MVLGRASDSGRHAHRAIQLVLGLDGPFRLHGDGADGDTAWAVLAPQQHHRLRGDGQRLAHLFVDPGPRAWQHWCAAGNQPRPPTADLVETLNTLAEQGDVATAAAVAQRWRHESLPGLADGQVSDARIAAAVGHIDADPCAPGLGHRDLARRVHLSPSRFLALFRDHTGLPVRNYVLWRRLLLAVRLLDAGDNVTNAAHAAGFADAAHLSRSVRKVLGAAPSELRGLLAERAR